ncbi:38769_t:CDS:2 [Gigaspora margarita]|uniref:38769_t:CDS:1 n=1 Tax=Gigaspora margarita TaxID=4874 RepID=A0ABN7V2B3_GIGMA|nr:38769_t:CDS:2 [Gigaspora margarita]
MKNKSDIENIKFIKTLQNDNIYTLKYSEVNDTKLIKIRDYGITVKGHWRGQLIIMKHIPNGLNQDTEALREFVDLETNSHFLVLEYAGNGNLHDYLSENKNLKWPQKIKISKDIACGLEFLHNIDMIHQNLNTKTIFINNEKVQILNPIFLKLNIEASSSMSLQEGMIGFTDPELLRDPNPQYTKSSDIYSLGMIMWSITSGKLPFENYPNKATLLSLIMSNDIRENPINGTPQEYLDLYSKCLKLNSKERPSAQDVYTQLNQFDITLQKSKNMNSSKNILCKFLYLFRCNRDDYLK